jgi:uncharacterized protein
LERAGELRLLPALFDEIFIPPEVQAEFGVVMPWLKVVAPRDASLVEALRMSLDDGEAEAVALACELGCEIILDERKARAVAERMNLRCVGTGGLLMRAKKNGVIAAVKPLLDKLADNGFHASDELRARILILAGE